MTDKERKQIPVFSGLMRYFPRALREVASNSQIANEQHNPGEKLHWAKEKSYNELDSLMRHLSDIALGEVYDTDGVRHAAKVAWRGLANLERELECKEREMSRDELVRYYADQKEK